MRNKNNHIQGKKSRLGDEMDATVTVGAHVFVYRANGGWLWHASLSV